MHSDPCGFLEPVPALLQVSPLPWYERPEILIPVILGGLAVLIYVVTNWRGLVSSLRTRHDHILDPIQLEEMMVGIPPVVVDLRSHEAFLGKHGHIRNSVNIPFPELPHRFTDLRQDATSRGLVLVDEGDLLAHQAYQFLDKKGFKWLYVLRGGLHAWRSERFPTYRTEVPPQPPRA